MPRETAIIGRAGGFVKSDGQGVFQEPEALATVGLVTQATVANASGSWEAPPLLASGSCQSFMRGVTPQVLAFSMISSGEDS